MPSLNDKAKKLKQIKERYFTTILALRQKQLALLKQYSKLLDEKSLEKVRNLLK